MLLLFGLGLASLHAQEALLAAGGNALGSGGSVSYSVGQVFYAINLGVNGSVEQGVQQPYEISFVPEKADSSRANIICSVFPNPVTDHLTLTVENYEGTGLSYKLYNGFGQQIDENDITNNQVSVKMGWLAPAIYLLKITIRGQEIKTFKIIKRKVQ